MERRQRPSYPMDHLICFALGIGTKGFRTSSTINGSNIIERTSPYMHPIAKSRDVHYNFTDRLVSVLVGVQRAGVAYVTRVHGFLKIRATSAEEGSK